MTAPLPYADLERVGAGHYEGRVTHYPGAPILYVMTSTPAEKLIGLWEEYTDDGATARRLVGSGIMHQRDGAWSGSLVVGRERWGLSAALGSARVVLHEHAEAAP